MNEDLVDVVAMHNAGLSQKNLSLGRFAKSSVRQIIRLTGKNLVITSVYFVGLFAISLGLVL